MKRSQTQAYLHPVPGPVFLHLETLTLASNEQWFQCLATAAYLAFPEYTLRHKDVGSLNVVYCPETQALYTGIFQTMISTMEAALICSINL
jgi:hypothetical protein